MKRKVYDYVKSVDKYANPVQLSYNGKKSFTSFCGGVATLISAFLILYWWVITFCNHMVNPYKRYSFSQQQYLTSEADQERPTYNINSN